MRRLLDRLVTATLVTAAAALLALGAGALVGYRALTERSGSMQPSIQVGDLLLSRSVPARDLRVGDVVSFPDARRKGVLLTHRVTKLRRSSKRLEVTTRGDANPAPESWAVPADARVGRLSARIPVAGYAMAWLGGGPLRSALLALACGGFAAVALRRIWCR